MSTPNKKSNSFILDFSEKVVTLSDREGRLEMTTEKRSGQDVIHFSIYQGSTRIYDSLEMTILDGGEIALCSSRPQSLSGFWEWVKKCFGPRKLLANTV